MNGRGPTPFETRVYDFVRLIPRGRVATYGDVARALGTKAFQAVGMALAKNPFAPAVPCHRVVRADGDVGGFNGHASGSEPMRKARILQAEGVEIGTSGKIDLSRFAWKDSQA
jgi:O-6-methylguanine DNA methyltransferase